MLLEISNSITLIVTFIYVINILFAGFVVFIERRDVGATWAWLMILFFVPVAGFIVYLFLGRQLKQTNFYRLSAEERRYLKSAASTQIEQIMADNDFENNELLSKHLKLLLMNIKSSNALVTTDNEVTVFSDGRKKFEALFEDIRKAKQEINIQYYIIKRDSLGKQLRDELTKKAKEGVTVRVLYDEIGSRRLSPSFFKELISYGGKVEVFFPSIFRFVNFRVNNRNHRKLCIIDGHVGYIGGFNVGDEYLGLEKRFGYWRDTHLRIEGEAANHIQDRFILDWQQATNQKKANLDDLFYRTERHTGNSPVQIVGSGPNSRIEHLKNMYIKMIMTAKESVFIQTPYFIPDVSFMDACKIALLAGVDVRIMIPNKPDHPFVYWATWSYVGELLNFGAEILLYENGFMHAKTIVVDQEVASVGTTNIDSRSFKLNFEVNAIVYDKQVAEELHELFLQDSEVCSKLTLKRYRKRSIYIKLKEAVSRLLSPIL